MRTISKLIIFVVCGVMVTSAQAVPVVLQNPNGMTLAFYETAGIQNWGGWATDTLGTAYAAGQVDIGGADSTAYIVGVPTNMIDGVSYDYDSGKGFDMWHGNHIDFKFNAGYTGGRTLGPDGGLRISTDYHADHGDFHYRIEYSTTDAPETFQTLVEVQNVANNWLPKVIIYTFEDGSTPIDNIDTIRYRQLYEFAVLGGSWDEGVIQELDVNLVPGPVTAQVDITAQVDMLTQISTVPSLYNVGYAGWSDITNPSNVNKLNEVNVKHMRMFAMLNGIFGSTPNDPMNLDYTAAADG
ncbi:MAG: hypothetical protein DRH08_14995, partial [Deltaproteobacteria bacterium]